MNVIHRMRMILGLTVVTAVLQFVMSMEGKFSMGYLDDRENFLTYLREQLKTNSAEMEEIDDAIVEIKDLMTQHSNYSHLQMHEMSEKKEKLFANTTLLLAKKKEIEREIEAVAADKPNESPDIRCLVAIYRGLRNKSIPIEIAQEITMEAKEQIQAKHLEYICDWINDFYETLAIFDSGGCF